MRVVQSHVGEVSVGRTSEGLFGLNDDELLPDLHITGVGVLRTGLGFHQEHRVNHDAQAADRTKVLLWPLTLNRPRLS